ncbi:MmyB family transcriptional regulator [Deinococcus cellulosilyticus]|uniref:MmyB-like transcription regulator ligand binding domain-containing protein n=1 Tax=Deinococcus cellulosilyticus (strain DSM 18568 / NBRC 106333 / KACC 11606 / 5516J-15) TaxID=1223518 RepID=A0A511N343_DEIC1|nr:hypothetical protein [Deinococcus cellulosilyticus]GEM47279.1 hypothetical protein DC3_29140 [Deinococcus cellulosilyticus NBRC 106333 = KACC 11606]
MTLLTQVTPECRPFAETCEDLLKRRQSGVTHLFKTWTRDEVCDLVYSSYKAMLRGGVRHPPRRNQVLDLADYFECTLAERNSLLVSAGYAPLNLYLTGPELAEALQVGMDTLNLLPFPSVLITRDWSIHAVNAAVLEMFQVEAEVFHALPEHARHLLHLAFDPGLPLYHKLSGGTQGWWDLVVRDVLTFRRENQFATQEPWFQARLSSLLQLPGFPPAWKQAGQDHHDLELSALHRMDFQMDTGEILPLRLTYTLLGELDYPRIMSYIPMQVK